MKKIINLWSSRPLTQPAAYNQRDVMGLKFLTEWTKEEEFIQKKYNRVLQPGFMYRNPLEVFEDAKLVGEKWLTDICCPSISTALYLHIAKEMAVNYKIKEDELNIWAMKIYEGMVGTFPNLFNKLKEVVESKYTHLIAQLDALSLIKLTHEILNKNNIHYPTRSQFQAAERLALDNKRKKIIHELVSLEVKEFLEQYGAKFNLQRKTLIEVEKTNNYCFLGAAGSGKSTLARKYITEDEKSDYIILAIDNYRVFVLPDTENHEEKKTKDVFAKTQDISYMVKELVQEEINDLIEKKYRPNIICDCLTLDQAMHDFLSQGTVISFVAAYRGEPGYIGIAERAYERARDIQASPADSGRYVNTTSLLEGHAKASSSQLLSGIPNNSITMIYDTNVQRGSDPKKIGMIDNKKHIIEIDNLRIMSEFLNKQNINIDATNPVGLIFKKNLPFGFIVTHPQNKAKSILDLVIQTKYKLAYTVKINDINGITYAELVESEDKKIILKIVNQKIFAEKIQAKTIEATVLQAIVDQIKSCDSRKLLACR